MPERALLPPSMAEDMPAPTVELALMGAIFRAYLQTLSPKKRREFLESLMRVFEQYETDAHVVRLRAALYDGEVKKARRGALAWVRGMMAAFLISDLDRPRR